MLKKIIQFSLIKFIVYSRNFNFSRNRKTIAIIQKELDWNLIRTEVLVLKLDKKEKKRNAFTVVLLFLVCNGSILPSVNINQIRSSTETCSFWSHARTFKRTANFNLDAFQWTISSVDRPSRIFLSNARRLF